MKVYIVTVSEVYLPIVTYLNVRKVKISFSLALLYILFSPCKKGSCKTMISMPKLKAYGSPFI